MVLRHAVVGRKAPLRYTDEDAMSPSDWLWLVGKPRSDTLTQGVTSYCATAVVGRKAPLRYTYARGMSTIFLLWLVGKPRSD